MEIDPKLKMYIKGHIEKYQHLKAFEVATNIKESFKYYGNKLLLLRMFI